MKNELKDLFCYKFLVLQMTVIKCNISKDLCYVFDRCNFNMLKEVTNCFVVHIT